MTARRAVVLSALRPCGLATIVVVSMNVIQSFLGELLLFRKPDLIGRDHRHLVLVNDFMREINLRPLRDFSDHGNEMVMIHGIE